MHIHYNYYIRLLITLIYVQSTYRIGEVNHPMFAVAWHDAKCKTIVSNRGHTGRGNDIERERHNVVSVGGQERTEITKKTIKQPQMIEMFFEYFSCIDIHDHLRQGSLKMEESWKTKTWWHRIFATVYGVIITDCYYAYKYYQTKHHMAVVPYIEFVDTLCYELIFNTYLIRTRAATPGAPPAQINFVHQLAPLRQLPCYAATRADSKKRAKRRCKVCGEKTPYYCVQCSNLTDEEHPDLVCLCNISLKTCFLEFVHGNI